MNKRLFQHGIFSNKASFNFRRIDAILIWIDSAPSLTAISRDKISASVQQASHADLKKHESAGVRQP